MNKTEYLNELGKRLKYIPREDREDALEYYTELISDMGFDDSEDVTLKLGSAKEAAKKILDECTQKHVTAYEENKTAKGRATVIWLSILGLLSLPLSLPLAAVVLALVITVIAVFVALLISLAAVAVSLVLAGCAFLIVMWMAPGIAQKVMVFGLGLSSLSIGVLLGFGLYYLVRGIIHSLIHKNSTIKEIE